MTQLIDKSAIVAEIKNRLKSYNDKIYLCSPFSAYDIIGKRDECTELLSFIDTLEVKEIGVDLGDPKGDKSAKYIIDTKTLEVKEVEKPTAADKGTAEEVIVNLKRVEQDYHIDLTREMEWLRNKVRKGE